MNKSLFKIGAELQEVEHSIESSGGEISEDTEFILETLSKELATKSDGIVEYYKSKEAILVMIDERIKEFTDLKKREQNKLNKFNEYIVTCMDLMKTTKIEGQYSKCSIRKPSEIVNITDDKLIPMEYIKSKVSTSIDKASIKEDLKKGKLIDGAKLTLGTRKATFKI